VRGLFKLVADDGRGCEDEAVCVEGRDICTKIGEINYEGT
jgi:hypothetical protein